jgi:hypothetical protein
LWGGDHRGVAGTGNRAGLLRAGGTRGDRLFAGLAASACRSCLPAAGGSAGHTDRCRHDRECDVQAAQAVAPAVEAIRAQLATAPVAHFDETGMRVAGRGHWTHVACTDQLTLYHVDTKRGREGWTPPGSCQTLVGGGA